MDDLDQCEDPYKRLEYAKVIAQLTSGRTIKRPKKSLFD
jgi:hypothetical protein